MKYVGQLVKVLDDTKVYVDGQFKTSLDIVKQRDGSVFSYDDDPLYLVVAGFMVEGKKVYRNTNHEPEAIILSDSFDEYIVPNENSISLV